MRLAAKAPRRRRPVSSTLDRRARRHANGPATSNQGAQMQRPFWLLSVGSCVIWRRGSRQGRSLRTGAEPCALESGCTECSAIRHSVQQGRFAPPRCAGQSVRGGAAGRRRKRATAVHSTYSPAVCRTGKLSPPTVVLSQTQAASVTSRSAAAAVQGSHVHHHRTQLRSNMALNRRANGKAARPRGSACLSSASRPGSLAAVARLALR
jgi:hypothetical protein